MSMRPIKKGSADQSVVIRIIDSTDGTPENSVVWNTAGIDLWYRREQEVLTSITEATLATLDAAHADGGFLFIGDGYYRLDLPDAAVAAGTGKNGVMVGGTVTDMTVIGCYIPLVDYDPYDTVSMGMTAINAILSLLDDARAEPGQGAPPVNPDMATKVDYVYKFLRNLITNDGSFIEVYDDAGTTVDHKAPVSEVTGTVTRGEFITGP